MNTAYEVPSLMKLPLAIFRALRPFTGLLVFGGFLIAGVANAAVIPVALASHLLVNTVLHRIGMKLNAGYLREMLVIKSRIGKTGLMSRIKFVARDPAEAFAMQQAYRRSSDEAQSDAVNGVYDPSGIYHQHY